MLLAFSEDRPAKLRHQRKTGPDIIRNEEGVVKERPTEARGKTPYLALLLSDEKDTATHSRYRTDMIVSRVRVHSRA